MLRVTVCITLMFGIACQRSSALSETSDASARGVKSARVGSCDRAQSTGTCSEYAGSYLEQNEILLTSSCGKLGGTFVYAECPNTSVVGACTLSTGESRMFYGTGGAAYEPDRARIECTGSFHGSWRAR